MKTILKLLSQSFLCYLAVFLFMKHHSLDYKVVIIGLVLSIVSWLYHYIRQATHKFWTFALFHLLGIAISCTLIAGNISFIGWFCLAIVLASVVIRYAPIDLEEPRYLYLLLFILVYYLAPTYQTICLYMTILYFLIVLLYRNIEAMHFYIATRSLTTSVDEKELKQTTSAVSFIYFGVLGLILCFVGIVHTNQVWRFIGRILRKIIRFVSGLFIKNEAYVEEETPEEDPIDGMPMFVPEKTEESSPIMEILSNIFQFLLIAVFTFIVITLLVKLIIRIYHYFYESRLQKDSSIVVERITRLDDKINPRHMFRRNTDKKHLNRIRKMYRKILKKQGAKNVAQIHYMSPQEQLHVLCKDAYTEQDLQELQQLYEKARYSSSDITADEIAKFKTIFNERKHAR